MGSINTSSRGIPVSAMRLVWLAKFREGHMLRQIGTESALSGQSCLQNKSSQNNGINRFRQDPDRNGLANKEVLHFGASRRKANNPGRSRIYGVEIAPGSRAEKVQSLIGRFGETRLGQVIGKHKLVSSLIVLFGGAYLTGTAGEWAVDGVGHLHNKIAELFIPLVGPESSEKAQTMALAAEGISAVGLWQAGKRLIRGTKAAKQKLETVLPVGVKPEEIKELRRTLKRDMEKTATRVVQRELGRGARPPADGDITGSDETVEAVVTDGTSPGRRGLGRRRPSGEHHPARPGQNPGEEAT